MASFSVLSILVLVAILHASSAFPTSDDADDLAYADWLKYENSINSIPSDIGAYRRTGSGSGSGSAAPTPPPTPAPTPPTPAPTPAPTAEATIAESTVVATSTTVERAEQEVSMDIVGGAAAFTGELKSAVTCAMGTAAGTMAQDASTGVCTHNSGCNTVAAATPGRRGTVIITVTYSVDSAVATVTLTVVMSSANEITRETLATAIQTVVNANPAWAGTVVPTILAVSATTVITAAATSSDSDNTGVIVGAVIGSIVGIAIIAGIVFFVMKKNSDPSPAKVEPFDQQVGVRAQ